ncbi:MAG: hypothetical protein FJX35_09060 [Alphaproteobacteria bacterium]|nr:hypothetical protein [Alphaproteobacteria bacterium]
MSAEIVGSVSWPVFFFGTVVLFGWFALMTAQALAHTWRPWTHCLLYGVLLAVGHRTYEHMLFAGDLISIRGLVVDVVFLVAVMLLAYRVTLVRKMVRQYPWLYEPDGILSWREKRP